MQLKHEHPVRHLITPLLDERCIHLFSSASEEESQTSSVTQVCVEEKQT
jgi:hypothetical protein